MCCFVLVVQNVLILVIVYIVGIVERPLSSSNTSISAREPVSSDIARDFFSDQKTLFISSSAFRTSQFYKKFSKNKIIWLF